MRWRLFSVVSSLLKCGGDGSFMRLFFHRIYGHRGVMA